MGDRGTAFRDCRLKIRYTHDMKVYKDSGFEEMEHTADWELRVWAADLIHLLDQAARGMYALSQLELAAGPRVARSFEIPFVDAESLLVDFLSEILFFGEGEGLAFDK